MNPSYFRIQIPVDEAKRRLSEWWGLREPAAYVETNATEAVDLACDENGRWRGGALFFYENHGWSVFEDLTGGFGFVSADEWLKFALNDALVVAGYNDAVPYGELIVIEQGSVVRDFVDCPDDPDGNRNVGALRCEEDGPISSWMEVASFVDDDDLAFSETGWLWLNEPKPESGTGAGAQKEANLQRWIDDGGPANWVSVRNGKWADRDWEMLVQELETTEYWPVDPDQVGSAIEKATRDWESKR